MENYGIWIPILWVDSRNWNKCNYGKYEEENIMVGEEIPIQHEDNLVNMEIEEGENAKYDVN